MAYKTPSPISENTVPLMVKLPKAGGGWRNAVLPPWQSPVEMTDIHFTYRASSVMPTPDGLGILSITDGDFPSETNSVGFSFYEAAGGWGVSYAADPYVVAYDAAISPDGTLIAVITLDEIPGGAAEVSYVRLYTPGSSTPVASYAVGDSEGYLGYSLRWSPDSAYLLVQMSGTGGVRTYRRTGPASLEYVALWIASVVGTGLTWSPRGNYVISTSETNPASTNFFVTRKGHTFTSVLLSTKLTLPGGSTYVYGPAWSPCGQYLALSHATSYNTARTPALYKFNPVTETFSALTWPTAPGGTDPIVGSFAWSPCGRYLTGAGATISVISRVGDTFTYMPEIPHTPPTSVYRAVFSADGQYLTAFTPWDYGTNDWTWKTSGVVPSNVPPIPLSPIA